MPNNSRERSECECGYCYCTTTTSGRLWALGFGRSGTALCGVAGRAAAALCMVNMIEYTCCIVPYLFSRIIKDEDTFPESRHFCRGHLQKNADADVPPIGRTG